jgi:predicted nucleic acid-binding protein
VRVLIDTDIILDYALIRQPFYDLADCIFVLIEQGQIEGCVSASTFTDLFYILRKPRGKEWTLSFLQRLAGLCQIVPTDSSVIKEALNHHYKDFEDDVQFFTAVLNNLDAIVTRNSKDFPARSVSIMTPEQLLQQFENS